MALGAIFIGYAVVVAEGGWLGLAACALHVAVLVTGLGRR